MSGQRREDGPGQDCTLDTMAMAWMDTGMPVTKEGSLKIPNARIQSESKEL